VAKKLLLAFFIQQHRRKLARTSMYKYLLCLALFCIGPSEPLLAQTSEGAASAAFDRLRALRGDWEGTFAWSGGRNATGKMDASYYTTGNGSAVVENLSTGGEPSMTSVYHLDDQDLRLTHFCAAQNQPRLRATAIDLANGQIAFSFVDITNLRSPTAGHVESLEVRLLEPNHVTLRFRFRSGSNESDELVDLRRKTVS
jgi:hypothetical protein